MAEVNPEVWPRVHHEPRRTHDGNPAHGCEMCDGDDICTCPGKHGRARCLTCGGRWPDCEAGKMEFIDDGFSENYPDAELLSEAERYMLVTYDARPTSDWRGPWSGLKHNEFRASDGTRYKVKVWWWSSDSDPDHSRPKTNPDAAASRQGRLEVVAVVERKLIALEQ